MSSIDQRSNNTLGITKNSNKVLSIDLIGLIKYRITYYNHFQLTFYGMINIVIGSHFLYPFSLDRMGR